MAGAGPGGRAKDPSRKRVRLDVALVEQGLEASRERARRLIVAGEVTVNGQAVRAPSTLIAPDAALSIGKALPYVSRGGLKLAHALDRFGIDVAGRVCLDAGASTGGFTDVLLQRGAARVYAVDVGKGQLAWTLRQDPRVVVMEGVNARRLRMKNEERRTKNEGRGTADREGVEGGIEAEVGMGVGEGRVPEGVSLVVADLAFISLRLVLPALAGVMREDGELVALVKPQFEAGAADVGKGGVVRRPEVHRRVLREVMQASEQVGLRPAGLTASPVRGLAGNVEFLLWARRDEAAARAGVGGFDAEVAVEAALREAPARA